MCNRKKHMRLISMGLFIVYMVVLIYFVLFAEMWGRGEISEDYNYNLVPFREIMRFLTNMDTLGWRVVMINILGNIAAFVPFGLFLPVVTNLRLNMLSVAVLTFDLSLTIELMQLITKVGSFDVDDLILNTVGGIIGYVICYFWDKLGRKQGADGIL